MKPGTVNAMTGRAAVNESGTLSEPYCAVSGSACARAAERLPESAETERFSASTLSAIGEARRISRDPGVRGYGSMEELRSALLG